jgi:hypothetical protein
VILVLLGEILVGEPRAKKNDDFHFFREFQESALRWIVSADRAAQSAQGVTEVILPNDPVTALVFEQAEAQRLLLGRQYQVRLVADPDAVQPGPETATVKHPLLWREGTDYPGRESRWDWLRWSNPWANG